MAIALAAGMAAAPQAFGAAVQTEFGIAGDASKVTKTVTLDMTDEMRFMPSAVAVARGDTVRFVLVNKGATMHEMVLGTRAELAKHAAMMKQSQHMHHDAPWMTQVKPGATGEIVWRFNRAGTFEFACLVPGHYESGMTGTVTVR
jgi:uncharacterized cupredoxin-like copper-binding protein